MTTSSVRDEQTLEISPILQTALIYSYKKQSSWNIKMGPKKIK